MDDIQRLLCGFTCWAALICFRGLADESASVYEGPVVDYSARITEVSGEDSLRVIQIRDPLEGLGMERNRRLVRVPLFFHAGEVRDTNELVVFSENGEEWPGSYQFDNVRKGPDGGVSRCDLYLLGIDSEWGELRLKLGGSPDSIGPLPAPACEVEAEGDLAVFKFRNAEVAFFVKGDARGRVKYLRFEDSKLDFGKEGAGPRGIIRVQDPEGKDLKEGAFDSSRVESVESIQWAGGALFGKMRVRYRVEGLEGGIVYEYYIGMRDELLEQRYYTYSNRPDQNAAYMLSEHILFEGEDEKNLRRAQVLPTRTGLDPRFPNPHRHFARVVELDGAGVFLPIGEIQSQLSEVSIENGVIRVEAHSQLRYKASRSGSLLAVSGGIRYGITDATSDEIGRIIVRYFNPLAAVVDEPSIDREFFLKSMEEHLNGMQAIGREPKIAERWVRGELSFGNAVNRLIGGELEDAVSGRVAGALKTYEEVKAEHGGRMPEWAKGKAYGGIDPYHMTYQASVVAALALLADTDEDRLACLDYAYVLGRSIKEAAGKSDDNGDPYIDCFYQALNMQMGPVILGLLGGASLEDEELVKFYRDLVRSEGVSGLYGKGQRAYRGRNTEPEQSDLLYQDISDFFLRLAELYSGENLSVKAAALIRYVHCKDVLSDLVDVGYLRDDGLSVANRMNMFRMQFHDHRWNKWSASPYMSLLWPGNEFEGGWTDACYFISERVGQSMNWPEYSISFLIYATCKSWPDVRIDTER